MIRTVVLLSGGLDSTVNLKRAVDETAVLLALTFDYGQKAARGEIGAATRMCRLLGVQHQVIELPWLAAITQTALVNPDQEIPALSEAALETGSAEAVWVPNRNFVFLAIGAAFAESLAADAVVAGFNAEEGRTFPDNSIEFISAANRLLASSTLRRVKVISYTATSEKGDIVRMGLGIDAPLPHVWSCYRTGSDPCWTCESCRRLERALRQAGALEWFLEERKRHG